MEDPAIKAPPEARDQAKKPWWKFAFTGAALSGCLLPVILMFILGMGGPLFWPIMSIPLGLFGLLVGTIVWAIKTSNSK
jgi:hypothetical protein